MVNQVDKKGKEPQENRPTFKRNKNGTLSGIITMGDMIDDQTRKKDKKE